MATAHLLHGFVGAGKSTFAAQLERRLDKAMRFTHDEWMHRLYGANPPKEEFSKLFERIDVLIWEQALKLLDCGVDVILDSGFWTRVGRDAARARIADAGHESRLYWIRCADDVMRARVKARSEDVPDDSLWINEAAFDLFRTRFEPLADDEERIEVDGAPL